MTVIEVVSNSPPNSKKAEPEKMHDGKGESYTPPNSVSRIVNKRVTFSSPGPLSGPPSPQELELCYRVQEILPGTAQDVIVATFRKLPGVKLANSDNTISEVVDALLYSQMEYEPRPVQGCAERPTQTDMSGMPRLEAAIPKTLPPVPLELESASSSTENSELQQAIQLSLQTQKLPTISEDPENMCRQELAVGIRNVGQSCWFNVIIQVLFHIPRYRRLIYFETPEELKGVDESNLTPEAKFLMELRKVFALLDAGKKRVVEPTAAIKALETEYGSALLGHQNDASEMRDRVIGVITRALRQAFDARGRESQEMELPSVAALPSSSSESMDVTDPDEDADENMQVDDPGPTNVDIFAFPSLPSISKMPLPPKEDVWAESPFRELFHYRTVKKRVTTHENHSEFDEPATSDMPTITCDVQRPTLHDAIEHHFIDDKTETYLETLPQVFFFTLNRFSYNNMSGTLKIHTELQIPKTIYMDRYMHSNYNHVKAIHGRRDGLRREFDEYTARCNGFEKFPVGTNNSALEEVLEASKVYFSQKNAHLRSAELIFPTPQLHVAERTVDEFLRLLDAYTLDVKRQQQECKARRDELKNTLSELFEVPLLQKEEYILHSVIIHEGEADRGHYWTYIRGDPNSNTDYWQKFNDSGVENVTWQRVSEEAGGRSRNSVSAYALCYVKATTPHLLSDTFETLEQRLQRIPEDLHNYISQKNDDFDEDIRRFKVSKEPPPPPPLFYPPASYAIFTPSAAIAILEPLGSPVNPIFPVEIDYNQFNEETHRIREQASKYRPTKIDENGDYDRSLTLFIQSRLRNVLKKRCTAYRDDLDDMMRNIPEEKYGELVQTIVEGIYEYYTQPADHLRERKDPRCEPLSWWLNTGLGMSAFSFRFLIIKSLHFSKVDALVKYSRFELTHSTLHKDAQDFEPFHMFQVRFHALYSLLKQLLELTRIAMVECTKNQKFDEYTVNDYFQHWAKTLMHGHLVIKVYYWLKDNLQLYAKGINCFIDVSDEIVLNYHIVKTTVMYPFLKLWRYVLYSILMTRRDPEAINVITESHTFNLITATLNYIAHWTIEGDNEFCGKISESVKEALNLCNSVLSDNPICVVNTAIENLAHALKPETLVKFSEESHIDLPLNTPEHNILELTRLKIEIGFADRNDALETITRLLEEAMSSLIAEFQ